jgi:hypothetical protein
VLKVARYVKGEVSEASKKNNYNNLFVKQFPRPDFSSEDLHVKLKLSFYFYLIGFVLPIR